MPRIFMDSVDKSAFYIYAFSRNKLIRLDAVYSRIREMKGSTCQFCLRPVRNFQFWTAWRHGCHICLVTHEVRCCRWGENAFGPFFLSQVNNHSMYCNCSLETKMAKKHSHLICSIWPIEWHCPNCQKVKELGKLLYQL